MKLNKKKYVWIITHCCDDEFYIQIKKPVVEDECKYTDNKIFGGLGDSLTICPEEAEKLFNKTLLKKIRKSSHAGIPTKVRLDMEVEES